MGSTFVTAGANSGFLIFESSNCDFTVDSTLCYVNSTLNFTDLSVGAISWFWDFGDGNTSILQNPSHIYLLSASYTVSLTINGSTTTTKPNYIVVLPMVNLYVLQKTNRQIVKRLNADIVPAVYDSSSFGTYGVFGSFPNSFNSFLVSKSSLKFWSSFCELRHSTGYTPNVASIVDSSINRLSLNSFIDNDISFDRLRVYSSDITANLESTVNSDLKIIGDLTIIIWFKSLDVLGTGGNLITCSGVTGSSAEHALYIVSLQPITGLLSIIHESNFGLESYTTSIVIPTDNQAHMIMIRRNSVALTYDVSIDNALPVTQAYLYNPTDGSSATFAVGAKSGSQSAIGEYFDVFVFSEALSNLNVTTMFATGYSNRFWFDYSNWNGVTGIGYVQRVLKSNHLSCPVTVIADSSGNIYVCDYEGKRVLKLDANLTYISEYDCSLTIGKPCAITYANGDLYVVGLIYDTLDGKDIQFDVNIERLTTSLVSVKNSNVFTQTDVLSTPTGICNGFSVDQFIITGLNTSLYITLESIGSFSSLVEQLIFGVNAFRFTGIVHNSDSYIYINNGTRLFRINSLFEKQGGTDTIAKKIFWLREGKNQSLLIFNSDKKKISRYDNNLNFVENVYTNINDNIDGSAYDVTDFIEQ